MKRAVRDGRLQGVEVVVDEDGGSVVAGSTVTVVGATVCGAIAGKVAGTGAGTVVVAGGTVVDVVVEPRQAGPTTASATGRPARRSSS